MAEYIDREAALTAIKVYCPANYEAEMLARIVCIPAVDVAEVRHGRWIEREDMYYGWNIWECSLCREEFCVEDGTPKDNEYNYCPNCGAKMEGDEE